MRFRLRTARTALWLLPVASLGACALWDDSVGGFESPRIYWHTSAGSVAECVAASAPGENCVQELLLCPDGGGHVVFDDIIDPIRFSRQGDALVVQPTYAPTALWFAIASDDSSLVEARSGLRWDRVPEQEALLSAEYCR